MSQEGTYDPAVVERIARKLAACFEIDVWDDGTEPWKNKYREAARFVLAELDRIQQPTSDQPAPWWGTSLECHHISRSAGRGADDRKASEPTESGYDTPASTHDEGNTSS